MTELEMLYVKLAEECSEVIAEVSKCLRFGSKRMNPKMNGKVSNREGLRRELNHVYAVAEMLGKAENYPLGSKDREYMDNHKKKYVKFSKLSESLGTLERGK